VVSGHGTQLHLVKNDWDMYSSVQSGGPKDSTLPREKELQDVKNKREERELVKIDLLAPHANGKAKKDFSGSVVD
jgi:hypothetical protein